MKKIVLLLVVLASTFTFAQNNGITYQAVIYSTNGESVPGVKNANSPLTNKAICLQFSIGDANSSTEYQEKVTVTTDEYGMVNLVIGTGTQTGGFATSFNTINWASSQKYLKVSVDQSGNCFSFELISNQILTYVPYALAANSAASVTGVVGIANGGTNATTVVGAKTNLLLQNVDNTTDLNKPLSTATQTALATKVDKVTGKELSSNDYTTIDKTKLAAITGTNTGDQDLSLFATTTSIALKANTADLTTGLATKVDKVSGKELSSNDYTTEEKTKLAAITGSNTGDQDLSLYATNTNLALKANIADLTTGLATKVDKVSGKELSSNDYTTVEKTKLAAITGTNTGDQDLSLYATITNLALKADIASPTLTGIPTAPTAASGTNTTQLATTAFVANAVNNSAGGSFVDLTTNQTIGGNKTFSNDLIVSKLSVNPGGGKMGIGTSTPDLESSLAISTALPIIFPSMSQTEINALTTPKLGMVQYNATEKKLQVYSKNTTSITTVFGNGTTTSSATCLASGELWFKPTISGNITKIELNAFGAGETASLVVKSDNSCGTPINLGTSNSITCIDGWNTWTFATPISVTAGTVYYITSNDANRCLGVRWSLTGDDETTGNVDRMMGMSCSNSSYDPASKITLVQNVSNSNEWLNLFNTPTTSSTLIDVANGGTGSSTKNFVDLTTDQQISGKKKFNSDIKVNGLTIGKGIGQVNDQNITVGENTLVNNTTGQLLIALGNGSLYSNTSANYNIGIGVSALANNQTGENNIAIGAASLNSNTGANNTAVGKSASQLGTSNSNVTSLGYQSGMLNTGSSNTFLGSSTDQTTASNSITNSTAIGYGAKISAANQIQLGNASVTSVKTSGSYTGSGFKTPTGTSSQFLMADGSVSSGSSGASSASVDLTTNQTIAGSKTFSADLNVSGLTIGGTSNTTILGANASGGPFSTTIGNNASSPSSYSVAIGRYSNAMTSYSVAIGGLNAKASESYSIAIGGNAPEATGVYSTAIGGNVPKATALQSTALGSSTTASGQNSTALGYCATVSSNNTIQLGNAAITNVNTNGILSASGFKTPTGTSSQFLMADGSVSSGSSGSSGPQILTETQRNALNLTSSGVTIFNSTSNQYQGSVYYTSGYNYNYFTTTNYGFTEIRPGFGLIQTFTGKGQAITSANIAVVNMGRVSNTGDFTFAIWDETNQYALFTTTITLSGAGTVSVTIPNYPWNEPRTLPNGPCSIRITSDSGTGGSADFLLNSGASVGSLSNSYWSSLGGTPGGYTTPNTSNQLAIDLFPQIGLRWASFN